MGKGSLFQVPIKEKFDRITPLFVQSGAQFQMNSSRVSGSSAGNKTSLIQCIAHPIGSKKPETDSPWGLVLGLI